MKYIHLMFLILIINGCENSFQTKKKAESFREIIDTIKKGGITKEVNDQISLDKIQTIENLYILANIGAEIKEKQDDHSKTLAKLAHGESVSIITKYQEWLDVKYHVYEKKIDNGHEYDDYITKRGFIKKSLEGKIDLLNLFQEDLNIISSFTKNGKTENYSNGTELTDYFRIELIDSSKFYSMKKSSIDFLLKDNLENLKRNGIINLKCDDKENTYSDQINKEAENQKYTYLGQLKFLNKYLIYVSYYEGMAYELIDKSTCETITINGFPYISLDKKRVISEHWEMGNIGEAFDLYEINNNTLNLIVTVNYKNWQPVDDNKFIGNDGFLYFPAIHVNASAYWYRSTNKSYQYLRLKIL